MYQNILKPTYLRELCSKYGLTPSKKYGQNYLITDAPIKKMIAAAELSKNDTVIEIGPGFGALTLALAAKAKKVIAFEIEKRLKEYWDSICHSEGALATEKSLKHYERDSSSEFTPSNDGARNDSRRNIEIIWGNALKQLSSIIYHLSSYKVVSNIPYQITSDLIRALLELENKPEMIVLMMQKEVAERICARPRGRDASLRGGKGQLSSLLSISVQYYGRPEIAGIVPSGCFWPRPKVDSAILKIIVSQQPPLSPFIKGEKHPSSIPPLLKGGRPARHDMQGKAGGGDVRDEEFFKVVKAGFSHKRKQLWNNISRQLGIDGKLIKQALFDLTGNEKIRAEELSVEEWKTLSTIIKKNC